MYENFESIWFGPKACDKYLILAQNIRKYRYSTQNIQQVSYLYTTIRKIFNFCTKYSQSIRSSLKTFKISSIWLIEFKKHLISVQRIQILFDVDRKYFLKWTSMHNIQKLSYLYTKHSKNIFDFDTKHLKSIECWPKTFERYLISAENIQKSLDVNSKHSKDSYVYTKQSKCIWFCSKISEKYRVGTQNIWK